MTVNYMPISSWADDEKPREKMLAKGVASLSTSELLAILIRSGSGGETALDLARRIMADNNNDLNVVARLELRDYMNRYKGIGMAKAASIMAAFEIARRRGLALGESRPVLSSSRDIYDYMYPRLADLDHEEFWVVVLNTACRVKTCEKLFVGGIDGLMVDLRLLFGKVLEVKAHSLVIVHNHPSGNLRPSDKDIALTNRVREAARLLDISLLDHLIIGTGGYYSFADHGIL